MNEKQLNVSNSEDNDMKKKRRKVMENKSKVRIRLKKFVCDWEGCYDRFRERNELLGHIRQKHTKEKPFKCLDCNKSYSSQDYLNRHQKYHNSDVKYSCEYPDCDFETQYPGYLRTHYLIHENIRNYKCSQSGCDKSFYTNTELKRHLSHVHTNERPFGCDWPGCEARFKTKQLVNDHKSIHLNERQFKCDFNDCQKSFNNKKLLSNHKQQHLKPYLCHWPACGQRFAQKFILNEHMNRHQDLRPNKCPFDECSDSFYSKPQLNKHIKDKHNSALNQSTSAFDLDLNNF